MNTQTQSLPRVVLLAAGQGSRLGVLAAGRPKSLMPVGGEPLLVRTLRQLVARGFTDITVVVGYQAAWVAESVATVSREIRCVENKRYATDTNIVSLLIGLDGSDASALIIEADIAFDASAMDVMTSSARGLDSVWFTNGPFNISQIGGILRADAKGRLSDLRYVPAYEPQFAGCDKLIGTVYTGPKEMACFRRLLQAAAAESTAQYYMMPWCAHLAQLPALAVDLAHCRTATFNTPEDYRRCAALFADAALVHA